MAEPLFKPPENWVRKSPKQSTDKVQLDAREAARTVGGMEPPLDPALGMLLVEMNGREAVLAFLLEEANERIEKLERRSLLVMQATSKLIDQVSMIIEALGGEEDGDGAGDQT